jgi:ABC-2 type transport system permease protein
MIPVVRAELTKVVTARSSLVICLLAVGLAYLIALISGLVGDYTGTTSPGRDLADLGQLSFFFAMVLGVLSIGGEFRHGSIAPSLLVTPSRSKLLGGKVIAVVIVSIVLCLITVIGCVAIGAVTLPSQDYHLHFSSSDFIKALLETAAVAPLWALVGLGTGALLRNQTGAIVLLLAWIFVVEGILGGLFSGYAPYAFGNAIGAAAGSGDAGLDNALSQGAAFAVSIGYAAALTAGGWIMFGRSDITG